MKRNFLKKFTAKKSTSAYPTTIIEADGYLYATDFHIVIRTSKYRKVKGTKPCYKEIANQSIWTKPTGKWIRPILLSRKQFPYIQEVLPCVHIADEYAHLLSQIKNIEVQYDITKKTLYFRSLSEHCEGMAAICIPHNN